ncbi:hypothetical protein [Devosia pacifica]|nr:hypothetical protein [Devosia pacifica]
MKSHTKTRVLRELPFSIVSMLSDHVGSNFRVNDWPTQFQMASATLS